MGGRRGTLALVAAEGIAAASEGPALSPGLLVLICADVIRPGLGWLLRFAPARLGQAPRRRHCLC